MGAAAAPSDPVVGPIPPALAVCSNLPACPLSPSLSGIEDSMEHGFSAQEEGLVVSMKKKMVKKLSPHSRVNIGSNQSLASLFRNLDGDLGEAGGEGLAGPEIPLTPSSRSAVIKTPFSTTHKSSRARDPGESMLERVERRTAEKNMGSAGNKMLTSPKFLVLPDFSDSHLLSGAADSGSVMGSWLIPAMSYR